MATEAAKKEIIGKVVLMNVRLSFPSLFEPNRQTDDDGKTRETWKANFLIPKDQANNIFGVFKGKKMPIIKALQEASKEAKAKKWGEDESKWPKLKPEKVFLRNGDLEDWDGYAGMHYVSANAQIQDRPAVVTNRKDGNGNWIEAEPGGKASPYSGCYVNATVVIWAQDNEHGKRLNAQVRAVQFFRDGEAFGAAPTNPNEDFTDDMVGEEGVIDDEGYADDEDDDESMV